MAKHCEKWVGRFNIVKKFYNFYVTLNVIFKFQFLIIVFLYTRNKQFCVSVLYPATLIMIDLLALFYKFHRIFLNDSKTFFERDF